jgi:hypothetical protein
MVVFQLLNLLQGILMYALWGRISPTAWWSWLAVLAVLFVGARTYYHARTGDDAPSIAFWYYARVPIFIADVAIVAGLFIFWMRLT